MPEISIIVPVYNVERYLKRCLDTLIDQTFKLPYEIICVNDGSTDSSPEILAEYDKKYHGKFKIITQENQGASVARNVALENVSGKYTMFVDADDFIAQNVLELLYNFAEAHNSEVVAFDFLKAEAGQQSFNRIHFKNIKEKYGDAPFNVETAEPFVYGLLTVGAWSKFYLTDFIKKIKFLPGVIYEDILYWAEVYLNAERINYYPVPFYFYVLNREDSVSTSKDEKVFDIFKVYSKIEKLLKNAGYFHKLKDYHYVRFASYLMCIAKQIKPEIRKKLIQKIKNYDFEIDYDKILNGDFMKFQKEDIYFIKLIKENDYKTVEEFCYEKNIWIKEV